MCSILLLLAFAVPASAQEEEPQDQEDALEEAREALREGDAELAIDILEEARRHEDTPPVHYELYIAHAQAREYATAAAHLESYLAREGVTLDPEERTDLEGHLADLRALAAPRPPREFWADPAVPVVGWTLLGVGIAGVISFPVGAAVAFTLESQLDPICRESAALCTPGERDGIEEAWIAGSIGLGVGLALGAVGAVFLFFAGEHEDGGSRSLPPDLDPTMQRSFSLAPWVDPAQGAGGVTMASSF